MILNAAGGSPYELPGATGGTLSGVGVTGGVERMIPRGGRYTPEMTPEQQFLQNRMQRRQRMGWEGRGDVDAALGRFQAKNEALRAAGGAGGAPARPLGERIQSLYSSGARLGEMGRPPTRAVAPRQPLRAMGRMG